jgi:hypothetical protein
VSTRLIPSVTVLAAAYLPSLATAPAAAAPTQAQKLEFPVSATFDLLQRPMTKDLIRRVRRDRSPDGSIAGWTVVVHDKRRPKANLLYHSRLFHGPHPSMLDAWHLQSDLFPAVRQLPVHGYPWEVRIRCEGCTTQGTGDQSRLVAGTLEVSWYRLRAANPRQE